LKGAPAADRAGYADMARENRKYKLRYDCCSTRMANAWVMIWIVKAPSRATET